MQENFSGIAPDFQLFIRESYKFCQYSFEFRSIEFQTSIVLAPNLKKPMIKIYRHGRGGGVNNGDSNGATRALYDPILTRLRSGGRKSCAKRMSKRIAWDSNACSALVSYLRYCCYSPGKCFVARRRSPRVEEITATLQPSSKLVPPARAKLHFSPSSLRSSKI